MSTVYTFFTKILTFILSKISLSNFLQLIGIVSLVFFVGIFTLGYQAKIEKGRSVLVFETNSSEVDDISQLKEAALEELKLKLEEYGKLSTKTGGEFSKKEKVEIDRISFVIIRLATVIGVIIPECEQLNENGRNYKRNKILVEDIISKSQLSSSSTYGNMKH